MTGARGALAGMAQPCTPAGGVTSVSPCEETVSGLVTVSSTGICRVTAGTQGHLWQFQVATYSVYGG